MNEQDQRALWFLFHCRRCRKELRILSFRDKRFCFFIFFLSFFLSFFFFSLFWTRATDWTKGDTARTLEDCLCRRFDGSSSVCISDNFFPLSIFLVLFRGWHDILKEIEESSSRHRIAVTSSRRGSVRFFPQSINFGFFFSIYVGRDNFVISLPSSTAHFNWIPHEFSVLLGSCLFIKLQQLLTYFLLTHSEPHTLTLSSGSFFLKTLR